MVLHDLEILCTDTELNELLSSINEANPDAYSACHGSYHANFVSKRVGDILAGMNFDKRTIEIGKIAGLLHDIGCISGKDDHAIKSSLMCGKFLCKTGVTSLEKSIIVQAIADHSNGNDINSPVSAALLIADKTDLSKERVLNPADANNFHKNLCEVEKVDVSIHGESININFVASDKFSIATLRDLWGKAFTVPLKAAKYLGYSAVFTVNDLQVTNI